MLLSKTSLYHILNRLAFFTVLNFSLNLVGLWFSKLITKENFLYPESISNEFVIPIIIQSIVFGLSFAAATIFLKNKKFSWLAFAAVQFVLLHLAFVTGLKFTGGLHFETLINHAGLRYLSYNGQYLVEALFTSKPLNGNFENGIFAPSSTLQLYFQWVISIAIYYFAISWVNEKISTFFSVNKSKIIAE
ncbi:MAG: hypothetical protein ACOYM7_05650 [Paludibacter sp.]